MTFNFLGIFADILLLVVGTHLGLWIFGFVLVALCAAIFYSLALHDDF